MLQVKTQTKTNTALKVAVAALVVSGIAAMAAITIGKPRIDCATQKSNKQVYLSTTSPQNEIAKNSNYRPLEFSSDKMVGCAGEGNTSICEFAPDAIVKATVRLREPAVVSDFTGVTCTEKTGIDTNEATCTFDLSKNPTISNLIHMQAKVGGSYARKLVVSRNGLFGTGVIFERIINNAPSSGVPTGDTMPNLGDQCKLTLTNRQCTYEFYKGETIQLKAVADAGSTFTGWSGDCEKTEGAYCLVTIADDAVEVVATFEKTRDCGSMKNSCNNVCVDLKNDTKNCGICGNVCVGKCVNGSCSNVCTDSDGSFDPYIKGHIKGYDADKLFHDVYDQCSGDKKLIENYCNGNVFGNREVDCPNGCVDGACNKETTPTTICSGPDGVGRIQCNGKCIDPKTDTTNCGTCGTICDNGQKCVKGICQTTSSCLLDGLLGGTDCNGKCFNLKNNKDNCGACGNVCGAGKTCNNGTCQATSSCLLNGLLGGTDCNGSCKFLKNDTNNCGSCGNKCATGESCSEGTCKAATCWIGTKCDDGCKVLKSDAKNCGSCGKSCAEGEVCSDGACKPAPCLVGTRCSAGLGGCKLLNSDSANCGSCGNACPSGQTCKSGACTCPLGQTNCNGTCVNTANNYANCGKCGNSCVGDQTCNLGICHCPIIFGDKAAICNNKCVNTATDSGNCGSCGTTCNGGSTCVSGKCTCPVGKKACGSGSSLRCIGLFQAC